MTGRKFFVKALAGCFVIAVILTCSPNAHADTIVLEGNLKKRTLKPSNIYLLRGGVFISKKLKIKKGTQVFGLPGSFLVIDRGAKIDARGTATLKSLSGFGEMLAKHKGKRYRLVSLRFAGGIEPHKSFRVHKETHLTIRDEKGDEKEMRLFGSMLEMDGQFKLFSFVID